MKAFIETSTNPFPGLSLEAIDLFRQVQATSYFQHNPYLDSLLSQTGPNIDLYIEDVRDFLFYSCSKAQREKEKENTLTFYKKMVEEALRITFEESTPEAKKTPSGLYIFSLPGGINLLIRNNLRLNEIWDKSEALRGYEPGPVVIRDNITSARYLTTSRQDTCTATIIVKEDGQWVVRLRNKNFEEMKQPDKIYGYFSFRPYSRKMIEVARDLRFNCLFPLPENHLTWGIGHFRSIEIALNQENIEKEKGCSPLNEEQKAEISANLLPAFILNPQMFLDAISHIPNYMKNFPYFNSEKLAEKNIHAIVELIQRKDISLLIKKMTESGIINATALKRTLQMFKNQHMKEGASVNLDQITSWRVQNLDDLLALLFLFKAD